MFKKFIPLQNVSGINREMVFFAPFTSTMKAIHNVIGIHVLKGQIKSENIFIG